MGRKKGRASLIGIVLILCLSLIGCSSNHGTTIKIATKPMTEQFILSEMLAVLIEENTDLTVEITKGIGGGTANIHPALVKGEFDLYPEYTGTGWNYVLHKETIPDDETLYTEMSKEYDQQFQLQWIGLYGFNNTYGLAVRKEIAEKYQIKTYSDLAKMSSDLVFGAEYDFYEREDGFDALCQEYGLQFKEKVDLDIGLKYQAINDGQIDVMTIFTTDGQLSASEITVLEDDKEFYQTYYCGTVVRKDVIDQYPELTDILMLMDQLITEADMAKMNYEVEGNGQDEKVVAKEFLKENGLVK